MKKQRQGHISRREFSRGVVISALAAGIPVELPAQQVAPAKDERQAAGAHEPKLSPAARAEAEAKIQNILRKYGDRLSEEQKAEVRKSMLQAQESVEKLRAFPLENWDEPAAIFCPLTGKEA